MYRFPRSGQVGYIAAAIQTKRDNKWYVKVTGMLPDEIYHARAYHYYIQRIVHSEVAPKLGKTCGNPLAIRY